MAAMIPAPKRRWFQFRLGTLLLLVALLASLLAWRNAVNQRQRSERRIQGVNLEVRLRGLKQSQARYFDRGTDERISELRTQIEELQR